MPRTSHDTGDNAMPYSASLATSQPPGYAAPGVALAPGQTVALSATARSWPTILELFNAMKRRLVLATFLGLLVGMAAAAAIWLAMPNGKHRAQAQLQVKPVNRLGAYQNMGGEGEFALFRKREENLIKGRSLLERVVADPRVAKLPDIKSADDPVRYVFENVKIEWPADDLMAVVMRGDNFAGIRDTVNVLVELYLKDAAAGEKAERASSRSQLETVLSEINKQIAVHEGHLKKLAETGGGANELSNVQLLKFETEKLADLNRQLYESQKEINLLNLLVEQRIKRVAEIDKTDVTSEDLEKALETNEEVREKIALRTAQQKQNDRDEAKLLPGTPAIKEGRDKLRLLQTDLDASTNRLKSTVEKDIRANRKKALLALNETDKYQIELRQATRKETEADHAKTTARVNSLGRAGHEIIVDTAEIVPQREARTAVTRQIVGMDSLDAAGTRVILREAAVVTLNQNLNQKVFLAVVCFFAGCLVVMLAVAFLEWRSRRVDSVEQVVNDLGLRVIGTIPAFPSKQSLKNGDAAQSQNWRFVLNESVNSARTMLLHTAKEQNMQILMVTSAMQGEGKTSLASQLATSMATAGLRTLILDCDLRNPSMHKLFDAPLTPGCAEVLCQEIDVSDAVQPTSVPNLWLIPAGQCSNRVITALAQGHPLETLFNRLRGQFDFIVVDSCPVLPVADSLLVGQHVDGVVLSILQDISQLPKVMTTAEKLTQLNIPLLGAVVNGIKPDIHAYGYNYVKQLPA